MSFSEPFIRRPIATSLLASAMLMSGLMAYFRLPVAPLPRIDFPTIQVTANLPGASPETMASSVATPLERRFGRIAGLSEMTSTSSLGTASITLQFGLDRDATGAARDVQAAINAAGSELPANLPTRPNFRKFNPADAPIMILGLHSDTLPLSQVFDVANTVLALKISRVDGVGQVFVGGGQQSAVRVQVDPTVLAGMGLGLEDVRNAIAQSTSNQAKGTIQGSTLSYALSANDQMFTADAYKKIIVATRDGAAVRLGDIANVFDSVENERVAAWTGGKRAVILMVRREPGANILATIERVRALMPSLSASISPAITLQVAVDRAQTIRASVHDIEAALVLSVILVVLVVLVFLRSLRATAVPTVAVPLSLVGTFGVMYLLGYSIDNLSLMALTIATGFVVDDAIVVTENITRFIEQGMSPFEAALAGARQIGFTIVSITASLLAVFIPLLLMGGIVGRLFREFAVTLSIAIALSMVVSLTLTPMMCSLLLRRSRRKDGHAHDGPEAAAGAMTRVYGHGLRFVLDHSGAMLLLTVGALGLSVYLYTIIPKGLFPQQDTGMITGVAEAPQDISFAAMEKRMESILQVVQADPEVADATAFMGGMSGAGNTANFFIALKEKPERKSSVDQAIARLRGKLSRVAGITLFLQPGQDVRIGGRMSRTQFQYTLEDANLAELREWAPKMLDALRKLPELKDVNSDVQNSGLQVSLKLDRDTAARLGVSPQAVDEALYDAFGQRQIATMYTEQNYSRVVLEALPGMQVGPDAIDRIYVQSNTGAQIPIRALVHRAPGLTPLAIAHQGQFPAVTISFNLALGVSLGQAVDAVHAAELQIGLPAGIRANFQGTAQAFRDSLATMPILVLAALLAVYVVLGMLYESLIHPLTILSTLPSAGMGALFALIIGHIELSLIALIGIILLIGIVKKNAILMIDFALEAERDRGMSPRDAIYEACLLRFRPILMTALAALFGALPLAIGGGTGSELRRPLGITIVGGLLVSQLLTLFTTPVVYLFLDRFTRRRRRAENPGPTLAPVAQGG